LHVNNRIFKNRKFFLKIHFKFKKNIGKKHSIEDETTSCEIVDELPFEFGTDVLCGHFGLFPDATQLEFRSRLYGA
jgi:hypothetical protein